MQIIDALAKLGFSFWQIVTLIALYMFRSELKDLVRKITSLKVAGSEITWDQKSDTVAVLTDVKAKLEENTTPDPAAIKLIDQKIQNRLILALYNIKRSTTYLWPALEKSNAGEQVIAPIRRNTFERIRADIDALRDSGVADFDLQMDWNSSDGVQTIVIRSVSEHLVALVKQANAL